MRLLADIGMAGAAGRATRVERLAWRQIDAVAWDRQVLAAGGGYQLAWRHLGQWRRLLRLAGGRATLLRLHHDGEVIGHAAVASRGERHQLRDRLLLAPGREALWEPALAAVLADIGPGRWRLGQSASIDSPRHAAVARLPGVDRLAVTPYLIQAVDFADHGDWDGYVARLNKGVRHQVRASAARHGLALEVARGRRLALRLPLLLPDLARQPHRGGRLLQDLRHLAGTALAAGPAATLLGTGPTRRPFAWQCHAHWGSDTHYLAGAARRMQPSPAWWLTLAGFRAAFDRAPAGRVVLGSYYPHLDDGVTGKGVLLWRRQCRARDFPGSVVEFDYRS